MALDTLRPRTFTELVDAGFAVLRDTYATLTAAVAVILLPVVLQRVAICDGTVSVLLMILERILYTVADGAVVLLVSERLLGRRPELGPVLRETVSRAPTLLVAAVLSGLAFLAGCLIFIVPGIYVFGALFAMPMIVMLEDMDASEAATRSHQLAKGHVLRILGVLLLGFALMMAYVMLGGFLIGLIGLDAHGTEVATSVLTIVAYPLPSVMATLLYYDLRIRKEGFDLEMMAADLGEMPAGAVSAAGSS
jgi:hypothetical protein